MCCRRRRGRPSCLAASRNHAPCHCPVLSLPPSSALDSLPAWTTSSRCTHGMIVMRHCSPICHHHASIQRESPRLAARVNLPHGCLSPPKIDMLLLGNCRQYVDALISQCNTPTPAVSRPSS
ncbi:hypothetical protein CGRA01v4_03248 [Colletotrichum graminicola]|nr:hypothetical protein CGRA01v4_03248 [Colletotrichum graminicola]